MQFIKSLETKKTVFTYLHYYMIIKKGSKLFSASIFVSIPF